MACQTVKRSVRRSSAAMGSEAGEEGIEEDEDLGGFLRRFFWIFRESSLAVAWGSGSCSEEVLSCIWVRRRMIWIMTLQRTRIG
jgi:hypothetical protein